MQIFNRLIALSKEIANGLLNDRKSDALKNTDLLSDEDKRYIAEQLTNAERNKERLETLSQVDVDQDWKNVQSRIDVPVRTLNWKYVAAALFIGTLASGYFLQQGFFNETENKSSLDPEIADQKIESGREKATLTLEDGTEINLEKEQEYASDYATSKDGKLLYTGSAESKTAITYNYLTIARGGQYYVQLSDGTRVWLNSESKLKYPINFIAGAPREVTLLYGEAYFEVSPSTSHNGATFRVHHSQQEIEVFGTKFNINAYKNDSSVYTTLVEGKVSVAKANAKVNLNPNFQSIVQESALDIAVVPVDVFDVTSWKNGIFSFNEMPLGEIMEVLARWYDVDVLFVDADLKKKLFTGILRKNQGITDILNLIRSTNDFTYEINNRTIVFKGNP